MNVDDLYPVLWDSLEKTELIHKMNFYYQMVTDKKADYKNPHIKYINSIIDNYIKYRSAKFTDDDSKINSCLDTLEDLMK